MKLDSKFYGHIFKAKDAQQVPSDQYVVFLAKDNAFAEVLPLYRDACIRLGCDPEQVKAVDALIQRVELWRSNHEDLCKNPDAAGEKMLDSKSMEFM